MPQNYVRLDLSHTAAF